MSSRLKRVGLSLNFWIVVGMLVFGAALHFGPQIRYLPVPKPDSPLFLSRHAMERVLFVLPIAFAAFSFGWVGGLITLSITLLIMLPRVFLFSPYPVDAFMEVVAVVIVGSLMCWMVETQEKERRLRQEAAARLEVANAISTIVTQSLELQQVLGGALNKAVEVMGLEERGGIFLLDEEAGELRLAVQQGFSPEFVQAEERVKVGECLCGLAAQTGELIISENCLADPRHTRIGGGVPHAHVIVPLQARDKVVGVLCLYPVLGYRHTPADIGLWTTIGNEIGVAIENARLHQRVSRQLDIEKRLNEVAEKITSEIELARLLPKVLQIAKELVGAEGGAIGLLDKERGVITYPYLHNVPQELANVAVPRGGGLTGEVMTSGYPTVIDDYAAYPKAVPEFVQAGLKSVVAVPIVSGDRVFGALSVFSLSEKRSFSDRDLALVAGVGRQAGIAMENARLYEEQRAIAAELRASEERLRFYVTQITRAQEDERKRIARELHDETAQALVALSRRLDGLLTSPKRLAEPTMERLEELRQMTEGILQGVRHFSQDLRPPTLDDLGLLPTLEGLITSVMEQDGIEAELKVVGPQRRLSLETELVLFRIAQEALNNVKRHSKASKVVTTVEFTDGRVRITISDNGRGFELPDRTGDLAATGKLGLIGMRERAQLLGGTLMVRSKPGDGTTVVVDVPA
jgi:signal transduction histidine kinase